MNLADLRNTVAHVFVDDLDACHLLPADHHHLAHVLRVRVGEAVSASDGEGRYRLCSWRGGSSADALEPVGPATEWAVVSRPVSIALALVKADRLAWAVQKLTEVGVSRIVLFTADRSVVKWDDARRRRVADRMVAVAREASMQSRRCTRPEVVIASGLSEVVACADGPMLRAEPGGGALGSVLGCHPAGIAVGPEGGWSEREQRCIPSTCDLGGTILRTETAALVAAVLMICDAS